MLPLVVPFLLGALAGGAATATISGIVIAIVKALEDKANEKGANELHRQTTEELSEAIKACLENDNEHFQAGLRSSSSIKQEADRIASGIACVEFYNGGTYIDCEIYDKEEFKDAMKEGEWRYVS